MKTMKAQCIAVLAVHIILSEVISASSILATDHVDVIELPTEKRELGEKRYVVRAFGKDIDLNLRRSLDTLPKTLRVHVHGEDNNGTPTIDNWTHRTDTFQHLYTDHAAGASVMVEENDGKFEMRGLIADDLVIHPAPSDEKAGHVVHRVKRDDPRSGPLPDYVMASMVEHGRDEVMERRSVPNRIYVTVHVWVDYALWTKLDRTEDEVIRYIKIFYNGVNSLYSTMRSPSVSVSIQGITICKTASACNVIEENKWQSGIKLKGYEVLTAVEGYAFANKATTGEDYALMMVMTDYDLCTAQGRYSCRESLAGLANLGTVCAPYKDSKTKKAGISEDHGAYDGIRTVTHEIGHLLGMHHDGQAPETASCLWADSYIMGYSSRGPNHLSWSSCSQTALRETAQKSAASCLLNQPSSNHYGLVDTAPGTLLTHENQCKVIYGASAVAGCPGYIIDLERPCDRLYCKTSKCNSMPNLAEGSRCGPQRHCVRGECVCNPSATRPAVIRGDSNCPHGDSDGFLHSLGGSCNDKLRGTNAWKYCDSDAAKTYCCESIGTRCTTAVVSCNANAAPTPNQPGAAPPAVGSPPATYAPGYGGGGCGGSGCVDTGTKIRGRSCRDYLNLNRQNYCDQPQVIQNCCATRAELCVGFHGITDSCDLNCLDNPLVRMERKGCRPLLEDAAGKRFCDYASVKSYCCASVKGLCP